MFSVRRLVPAAACAAALAAAVPAQAGVLVSSATDCDTQTLSQPFLPWADLASYTLAPGGAAESGAGWSMSGASIAPGNEPWSVHAAGDSSSLSLPDGASATTGAMCVGIEHPTIRFFARPATALTGSLNVEVLFETAAGDVVSAPVATLTGTSGWSVSPVYPIAASLLPLLPGDRTAVAFRFSASGGGWSVDDVYVDPWGRI